MLLESVFAHVVRDLCNGAIKVVIWRTCIHKCLRRNPHKSTQRLSLDYNMHTWNWVSNLVLPVSGTTSCISLTFALISGALMELSPHMMASSSASWMNTYWGWREKGEEGEGEVGRGGGGGRRGGGGERGKGRREGRRGGTSNNCYRIHLGATYM